MIKLLVYTLVLLLWINMFAGTISPGGGTIAGGGGSSSSSSSSVTNNQPFINLSTNSGVVWALTPLTVSGITGVNSFLNSTNWQLYYPGGATNSLWVQFPGKTNFLYYDGIYNISFVFANTITLTNPLRGPTGIVIDTVTAGSESASIDTVITTDFGQWSPDATLLLTNSVIKSIARTNLYVDYDKIIIQQTEGGQGSVTIQNPRGEPLVQFDQDGLGGGGNYDGRVTMWGNATGNPIVGVYNTMRLHGNDRNILNVDPNADPRTTAIWGKAWDNTGTNGGTLYLITRAPIPTVGTFNYALYIDHLGNTSIGHNSASIDANPAWSSTAELNIVGQSVSNTPQLMYNASIPYNGNSNGASWYDGTNMWLYQTNIAASGKILINAPNVTSGTVQLSSGSNQVSTAAIKTLGTIVLFSYVSKDGNVATIFYKTNEIILGSKFTIRSSSATDTNNVNWFIVP